MIKSTHICDLCGAEHAQVSQGHATALDIDDKSLNYRHTNKVNFPAGWRKVGVNAICGKCDDELTKRILSENIELDGESASSPQ